MIDYTPEKLREIDAEIAVKVFGWRWMRVTPKSRRDLPVTNIWPPDEALRLSQEATDYQWEDVTGATDKPGINNFLLRHLPHYSTDIADAWKVVEKLMADGFTMPPQRPAKEGARQ